jgi:ElaB/YqjD/DUF883 family membrane-anchored ribosome-binding protein
MAGNQYNPSHGQTGSTGGTVNRMNTGSGGATGVMEKAQDTVSGVAEKAKDWAAGAADTAKDWAANVSDTAQSWASDVGRGAGNAYAATRDTAVRAEESVELFIRRHPLQSVLIAFGVGCLLGCAMNRR